MLGKATSMESPDSSARVIQETPNSLSDQSSVSYKDWKRSSQPKDSSPALPRGNTFPLQIGAQMVKEPLYVLMRAVSDTDELLLC